MKKLVGSLKPNFEKASFSGKRIPIKLLSTFYSAQTIAQIEVFAIDGLFRNGVVTGLPLSDNAFVTMDISHLIAAGPISLDWS
jgi:hypothetical protein